MHATRAEVRHQEKLLHIKYNPRMPLSRFFPHFEVMVRDPFDLGMKTVAREVQFFSFDEPVDSIRLPTRA